MACKHIFLSLTLAFSACTTPQTAKHKNKQHTQWLKQNGLVEATPSDIAKAKTEEVTLKNGVAISSDGSLRVVFIMGDRVPLKGDYQTEYHSKSHYRLEDVRTGKCMAKVVSTICRQYAEFGFEQRIWISPSDQRVLIYESWADGCSPHDTTALITPSEAPDSWKVQYLNLPSNSQPDILEHEATPQGFSGDTLLLNPNTSNNIYKIRIKGIKIIKDWTGGFIIG